METTTYRQYADVSIQSVDIIILPILMIADACHFIDAKQHEPTHLHTLMQEVRIADIAWLGDGEEGRFTLGESETRRGLLAEFVYWLFTGYIIPLIKAGARYRAVRWSY